MSRKKSKIIITLATLLSVVIPATFAISAFLLPAKTAFAAPGDVAIVGLLDEAIVDGKIDTVNIVTAYAGDTCTQVKHATDAGTTIGKFTVTSSSGAVTISTIAIREQVFDNCILQLNLDSADPQLLVDTSATALNVVYDNGGGDLRIDNAGNTNLVNIGQIATGLTESDVADPIIKTVTTEDTDENGFIDKITYTWTEIVDTDDGAAPVFADLPATVLPDGQAMTGATGITDPAGALAVVVATGVTGQLGVNTAAGSTAISGDLSTKWTDMAAPIANEPDSSEATGHETIVDGAAPIVIVVNMIDDDENGSVEGLELTFSESLAGKAPGANGLAVDSSSNHGSCTGENADPEVSPLLTVGFTCSGLYTAVGDLTLTLIANDGIEDSSGNDSPTKAFTGVSTPHIDDDANPIIKTVTTADTDYNGLIDSITYTWTENIDTDDSALPVFADLPATLLPDGQAMTGATGITNPGGILAVVTATGVTGQLAVNTAAGSTAISGNLSALWKDTATNVPAVAAATANETIVDAAGAIITARVTKDTDSVSGAAGVADGTMDGILATFSEAMDADSVAVTDFVITLNAETALTEAYSDTTDDTDLFFRCSNCTANDTGNLLKLQITGGDGILDMAGVAAVTGGSLVAATDGANPSINTSGFETLDNNQDGTVDYIKVMYTESIDDTSINETDYKAYISVNDGGSLLETFASAVPAPGGHETNVANDQYIFVGVASGTETIAANKTDYVLHIQQIGVVSDLAIVPNTLNSFGERDTTDAAHPKVISATVTQYSGMSTTVNSINLVYTEAVTIATGNGDSTPTKGDITEVGVIAGFGSFSVTGNTTAVTGGNEVGGTGTATIIISLGTNSTSTGYINSTSTTAPSGNFTPAPEISQVVADAVGNKVAPTVVASTAGTTWDLTQPTITTITYSEASVNGKIDRALIVFSEDMDDEAFTNANGSLASGAGTFSTGTAFDEEMTFNRTADTAATGTAASDGVFTYSGSTTLIKDWAGNLLNTATDGQIAASDRTGKEVDATQPVLVSQELVQLSNSYNTLKLTYSEPMYIDLGGTNGIIDDADITTSETGDSTTSIGGLTAADGTTATATDSVLIEGIGLFSVTSNYIPSAQTNNHMGIDSSGEILTITFNANSGTYFVSGTTNPSGTFTPIDGTYILSQASTPVGYTVANTRKVNTSNPVVATTVTSWDSTPPSQITGLTYGGIASSDTAIINWTAHSTLADFGSYMMAYGTSSGVGLASSLWKVSNDSALGTIATRTSNVSGLTEGNTYYMKGYGVDIAGNVGTAGSEISYFLKGASGSSGGDSGSPLSTPAAPATTTTPAEPADEALAEEIPAVRTPLTEEEAQAMETSLTALETELQEQGEIIVITDLGEEIKIIEDIENPLEKEFLAMIKAGVFEGNEDGTFDTSRSINRAEVAAVFCRILGIEPAQPEEDPYMDVPKDRWDAAYVQEMKNRKFISNTATTYGPETYISKVEFLKFATNILKLVDRDFRAEAKTLAESIQTMPFGDVSSETKYASDIAVASEKGFITGTECRKGECFYANGTITRGNAAKILYNMFGEFLGVK
ncbi:MAG: S-layer homology domain-containing protein [Candidatus Gracilibacteria bacterium]|jgi:hypothetical protein